ncbi:MAG TPA: hypothetical protein PK566_16615 [Pseudobacteroides sp.]|nr:hypothetical protein [Pseudobacteroides sp.]
MMYNGNIRKLSIKDEVIKGICIPDLNVKVMGNKDTGEILIDSISAFEEIAADKISIENNK